MDPNLELCRSLMHLNSTQRRQRLQHLSEEEYARVRIIAEREQEAQKLEELIAGRDLVQIALTDPSKIIAYQQLKYALLGRTTYGRDECLMIERITNHVATASFELVHYVANFDESPQPLPLDAWKLVYCDICYVNEGRLQDIYEERLQEEQLQTPAARARALVRDNELKKARRNAEWMIAAIERFSDEAQAQVDQEHSQSMEPFLQFYKDDRMRQSILAPRGCEKTLERIWKWVSPAPPAWIQNILEIKSIPLVLPLCPRVQGSLTVADAIKRNPGQRATHPD